MDKRKLIGTIIGVIMFAILIAGATYAFLTFAVNVTNGTYNGKTMKFLVDYTKGTEITAIPQLVTATPETAESLHVVAKKNAESVDGNLTIKLSTTSNNNLTTGSIVNWALCKGACVGNFLDAKATGKINTGGSEAEPHVDDLYTDPEEITDDGDTYYVYFWIDAVTLNNSHLGQIYSGYIHASATQSAEKVTN